MSRNLPLAELRHLFSTSPAFQRVFLADMATQVGDAALLIAFPMLILEATHDVTVTGLAFAGEILAFGLLSPFAGAMADRCEQKLVMIGADVMRIAWLALLWAVLACEGPLAVSMVLSVLLGATGAFFMPARAAFMRRLLDGEDLQAAIAIEGTMAFLVRLVAPAFVGLLLALFPATVGIAFDMVALAIGALLLVPAWVTGPVLAVPENEPSDAWREGWRVIARSEPLRGLLLLDIALSVCAMAGFSILVAFLDQVLHLPTYYNGYLMAVAGLAGAIGTQVASRLGQGRRTYAALCAVMAVSYLAVGLATSLPLLMAVWAVRALALGAFCVLLNQRIARDVEPHVMGRVHAAWGMGGCLAAFAGAAMTPFLLRTMGAAHAYTLFGVVLGLVALVQVLILFVPARVPHPAAAPLEA